MRVSIITACYNSAATIKDTINSVVTQDYADIEYIIVDGGSKDSTLDIVREYGNRISKIISEPDRGIYDAMNKGIRAATGDIVGILNSDDFFTTKQVIRSIVSEFLKDKSVEGIYTNLYYVKQNNPQQIVRHWLSTSYKKNSFFTGWHPPHPTLYLRNEVYKKYGDFNLDFPLAADFELMLRLFEKHRIKTKYINITTIRMRLGGATSKNWGNIKKQNIECLKAFSSNGFNPPLLYPVYRLLPKLSQFFKR